MLKHLHTLYNTTTMCRILEKWTVTGPTLYIPFWVLSFSQHTDKVQYSHTYNQQKVMKRNAYLSSMASLKMETWHGWSEAELNLMLYNMHFNTLSPVCMTSVREVRRSFPLLILTETRENVSAFSVLFFFFTFRTKLVNKNKGAGTLFWLFFSKTITGFHALYATLHNIPPVQCTATLFCNPCPPYWSKTWKNKHFGIIINVTGMVRIFLSKTCLCML